MKHPIRRRAMYVAFEGLRAAVRWLPLGVAQALGRLLGYVAYLGLPHYRRLSQQHLRLALGPAVSSRTVRRVVRGQFVHLAKNALEWFVFARLTPADVTHLVDIQGLPHLQRALAKGRGVIALSAHLGNWELLPLALASLGFQGGVLARRLRYPEYEAFLVGMRRRLGIATIPRGSAKDALALLRANQIVGLMPDQDIDSLEGIFVEFFGQPTYTPVGPAALSLSSGAPIVPCFIVRKGRRFQIYIEEPLTVPRTENRQADAVELTQRWSLMVESYIRRYPAQWVWVHRRWKTQPSMAPDAPIEGPSLSRPPQRRVPQPTAVAGALMLLLGGAGCAKRPPPEQSMLPDAPTQQMDHFTMSGYDATGAKHWDLDGTGALLHGQVVTIHAPQATGYEPQRTSYLTASLAHVHQPSRRIMLEHEVVIHTSDGLWLSSPLLYWVPDRDEVITDLPVRLETDRMVLRARGATGFAKLNTAVFQRDVELQFVSDTEAGMTAMLTPQHANSEFSLVTITCDGPMTFDYDRQVATFRRRVHLRDRQGDLYSDRLVAYLNRTTRTIIYAEATGNVRIVQGPHTASSTRAVYEPAKQKATLVGQPSLMLFPDAPATAAPPHPVRP